MGTSSALACRFGYIWPKRLDANGLQQVPKFGRDRQSFSSSSRCAASITSGGAGFCNQVLMRSNPPATVPTANTATTIQTAVDMELLSAYDRSFAAGYARAPYSGTLTQWDSPPEAA